MRCDTNSNQGSILVLVVIAMVGVMGLVAAGCLLLQDTQNRITDEVHKGQAVSISTAGLVEGLSWFRHQTVQPVTTFAPVLNLSALPPINETDDPNIGLVREFQISKTYGLWGRYEVRLTNKVLGGSSCSVVRDISIERNMVSAENSPGNGWSWYLESTGIMFQKADPTTYLTANFYQTPYPPYVPNRTLVQGNPYVRIVSSAVTSTEILRLVVLPPAGGGAICCRNGRNISLGSKCRVMGGSKNPGLVFPTGTGNPVLSGGELSGTPASYSVNPAGNYLDAVTAVFGGLSNSDLRTTADIYATSMTALPSVLPEFSLVYFKGNADFGASRPLQGTGILFVEGNLTIDTNSNSFYSGIIYVQGNYTQSSPSMVKGLVIVTGTATLSGLGDYAEVDYDPNILSQILMFMGQYRFSKPVTFLRTAN